MGDVMATVPGIKSQSLIQTKESHLGMTKRLLPVVRLQRSEQKSPALVQRFQQGQRDFNGRYPAVGQFRPAVLSIRLDSGFIFCQSELEADVAVQMAVGNVVNDLAHRP